MSEIQTGLLQWNQEPLGAPRRIPRTPPKFQEQSEVWGEEPNTRTRQASWSEPALEIRVPSPVSLWRL
eukprot:3058938-Pyramimonas_sp.AAC.1